MTTTRRAVGLSLLSPLFLAVSKPASALDQKYGKLLIIDSSAGEPYKSVREAALKELERLGYVSGKNLTTYYESIGNREGPVKNILKFRGVGYDVIFGNGTIAVVALKKQVFGDTKYKVVFGSITDPIGEGIIESFDTLPNSNFTGVCYPVPVTDRLRFVMKAIPKTKTIGLIDADMPQSHSYRVWLDAALKTKEFSGLSILHRRVPFIQSEGGHIRMAQLAETHIKELDSKVDVFMSANDQLGVQRPFAEAVAVLATKPLVGLGKKDVMEEWGATMSIYPDLDGAGTMIGGMLKELLDGKTVNSIQPRWPPTGVAFDLKKAMKFDLAIPVDLIKSAGNNVIR